MVLLAPASNAAPGQESQDQPVLHLAPVQTQPVGRQQVNPHAVAKAVYELMEADLTNEFERRGGRFNS